MLEYYTTFINYDTRTLYIFTVSIRPPTSVVIVTNYLPNAIMDFMKNII